MEFVFCKLTTGCLNSICSVFLSFLSGGTLDSNSQRTNTRSSTSCFCVFYGDWLRGCRLVRWVLHNWNFCSPYDYFDMKATSCDSSTHMLKWWLPCPLLPELLFQWYCCKMSNLTFRPLTFTVYSRFCVICRMI